jgi:hypothetical protein
MSATAVIILVALAALVLAAIFLGGGREPTAPLDRPASPGDAGGPVVFVQLDPTPYRQQISALEVVLYRQGSTDSTIVDHISFAARRLATAVRDTEGGMAGARAQREILAYVDEISTADDVAFTNFDLPSVRSRWVRLRNRLFEKAEWMVGVEDSGHKRAVRRADGSQPAYALSLRRYGDRLSDLIANGRSQINWMKEKAVGVEDGSPEVQQLEDDWVDWAGEWERQIDGVAATLPPPPAVGAPEPVTVAHTALAKAVQDLRLLSMPTEGFGESFISSREQRLDAAQAEVTKARINLHGIE